MTITQADREAAAQAYSELTGYRIDDGEMEGDWLAKRFAAHRIAALEEAAKLADAESERWDKDAAKRSGIVWALGMAVAKDFTKVATAIRNLAGEG